MHITVTSVTDTVSGLIIQFTCQYGTGRGSWKAGMPLLGKEYDVELDVNCPLRAGVNVTVTDNEVPRIWDSGYQTALIAKIEDVFDNDTASLRLGGSLILVDYEGVLPTIGTWVEVTLPLIELSDTKI